MTAGRRGRNVSEEVIVYRCILVPLDGTAFGEAALPLAVSIASRTGALLQLAHVHLPPIVPSGAETAALPPVWLEMSSEEKRRYLDEVAERLARGSGVRVETRVVEGSVATSLERHALSCAVGLVVMSTHWHVGLGRLWHNGVADQLARDLPLPVLLVRVPEEARAAPAAVDRPIRNILVPLDGSAEAELILEHAVSLGRPFDARLTLLQVVNPAGKGSGPTMAHDPASPPVALQSRTAARQYLNGLAERLRRHDVDVVTEVLVGEAVARTVLEHVHAARNDDLRRVDVIALRAPSRGPVSRLLFQGTADQLIRESGVPVLLFEAGGVPEDPMAARVGLVGSG